MRASISNQNESNNIEDNSPYLSHVLLYTEKRAVFAVFWLIKDNQMLKNTL